MGLREAIDSVHASRERLRLTREHLQRLDEDRRRLELSLARVGEEDRQASTERTSEQQPNL